MSHFGATNTTEARIIAMLHWLRWSLEKLQTDVLLEIDQPDEGDERTDELEAEPSTLPSPETEATSEIDALKLMFAQTLEMFQGLIQAQIQPSPTRTASNGTALPAATTPQHNSLPDRDNATRSILAAPSDPLPAPSSPTLTTSQKTRSRRSKSPETQAETAVLTTQILDAIQDIERYNHYIHQTQQPHRLKREITTNFLKVLTPNQRLINRILDEQQAAIQQHHHQMQIQPGHNSMYREKITLADIQQTLQGQGA